MSVIDLGTPSIRLHGCYALSDRHGRAHILVRMSQPRGQWVLRWLCGLVARDRSYFPIGDVLGDRKLCQACSREWDRLLRRQFVSGLAPKDLLRSLRLLGVRIEEIGGRISLQPSARVVATPYLVRELRRSMPALVRQLRRSGPYGGGSAA